MPTIEFWLWRHPRASAAAGRCIGRTDLRVDPRKAKRLAHRVRASARRHGLLQAVHVSPLRRCADVGRWLRRWGWRLCIDPALIEIDFGAWEGRGWAQIGHDEVNAWQADLLHHAPGGGESLAALAARARAWADAVAIGACRAAAAGAEDVGTRQAPMASCIVVSHGGWINALLQVPAASTAIRPIDAARWPAPPALAALTRWRN